MPPRPPQVYLASTSIYRRDLLRRLGLAFRAERPLINEEEAKLEHASLSPRELAAKLAELKARSLAGSGRLVIGGDQMVSFENRILGKPGNREKAIEQLMTLQGRTHELITATCLVDEKGQAHAHLDITLLTMRIMSKEQIEKIVDLDRPYDCAGAYKIEEHGIALMDKIESSDFTAIQGLPLMALSKMLENLGVSCP